MLVGLLRISGVLVLRIVYGKHYEEKVDSSEGGMIGISLLLSLLNVMWLLCLMFWLSGTAEKDIIICIIGSIVYPVCIAIWAIIVRKKYKKQDNTSCNTANRDNETKTLYCKVCGQRISKGSSICNMCGTRIND